MLLSFLGYFKYSVFFLESLGKLMNMKFAGISCLFLPLGISFYVFSALSYLVDVYRGEYPAERNFIIFALYIAFFPKLLAGPIIRGRDLLPQIRAYSGFDLAALQAGLQIFVFGFFKKKVLADHLAVFVDDVFHAPVAFSSGTILLAVVSYSLQIYFDFSGYSDMAIGSAKMLGFDFKPNFNLPYISENISDFWGRWHISLSSWFRDYLYITLCGNRRGKARTHFNLLLVMLVSGLWHGAGYTFILWGLLHGIACCMHKAFGRYFARLGRGINIACTFIIVTLFWVLFRADSIGNALNVYKGLFAFQDGLSHPYVWSFVSIVIMIVASMVSRFHCKSNNNASRNDTLSGFYPILDLRKFWSKVAFLTFSGLSILLSYFGNAAFIYGAF